MTNSTTTQKEAAAKKQFIATYFKLMDNTDYTKLMSSNKGITTTYQLLRRYIIRGVLRNDPFNLYEGYYLNGKLAASVAISKLCEKTGLNNRTVMKNIILLEEAGLIKTVKSERKKGDKKQPQTIYVLGKHSHKNDTDITYKETFFIDMVFGDVGNEEADLSNCDLDVDSDFNTNFYKDSFRDSESQ